MAKIRLHIIRECVLYTNNYITTEDNNKNEFTYSKIGVKCQLSKFQSVSDPVK